MLSWVALASAAPPTMAAEAAYRAARATIDRGDLVAAGEQIERALRRFSGSSYWVWSLHIARAEVLSAGGRRAEMMQELAPEPSKQWANSETAVRRLMLLAMHTSREKACPDAAEIASRAVASSENHQPKLRPHALLVRGSVATNCSDPRATALLREAVAAAKGDKRLESKAWGALSRQYGRDERYDEGIGAAWRASKLAREMGQEVVATTVEGNIGWMMFEVGELDAAERLLLAANAAAPRLGNDYNRPYFLINLGNVAFRRKDYAKARSFYIEAASIARPMAHPELSTAIANLAIVSLETGDFAAARRYSNEALDLKRKRKNAEAVSHSLLTDARIAQGTGGYNDAESLYRRVVASSESKSLRWEAHARLGQLLALRKKPDEAAEHFRLAIDTAEDARSDLKADELKLSFPTTVIEFYDAYIEFLVSRGRVEDALDVAELSRARALERRRGSVGRRDLDAQKVAREAGATILSYWLAAPRSYLWIVTPQKVELAPLPKDDEIGRQVTAYQKALRSASGSLARSGHLGQQLYSMLIPQAAAKAIKPGSRVIVIADDRLHALNFETLVTPQQKYWIEDVVVTTAASMQLLAAPRTASSAGSVLLIGNPPPADPAFPPLPRAGEEIQRVAKHFNGRKTVLEGKAATPSAYQKSQPQSFAFIHFVAHGTANQQVPLESAVILARDAESYKLYARDIVEAPLTARLVTISSCHGAGVRAYASEGLVGLAWAFLRAGAHQVVAALWEVNDVATPELMDKMYADISAGRDPATALRNAKLSMIHSDGVFRKPLYWAPFVLYSGS